VDSAVCIEELEHGNRDNTKRNMLEKEEQEKENKQWKKYSVKYLQHNGKIINKNES
jgi:hypothetical protein